MTLPEPLASYDPDSSSWRTYEDCFPLEVDGYSGEFSGPWPPSGMTRSGMVYALPTSERHTDGGGSSLLRTPQACEGRKASWHDTVELRLAGGHQPFLTNQIADLHRSSPPPP